MRLKGLDLNLLVALDALLAERSVSGAADRLLLSQPAMSGALSRLRDYFQDDLLVNSGRRMMLTPRAEELSRPVRAALVRIEMTVSATSVFDPLVCDRRFVIEASDYIMEVLIAPFAQLVAAQAPRITLEVVNRQQPIELALESGAIDLAVTPEFYAAANHPSEFLFEEEHVVVGWSGNRHLHKDFSIQDLYDLGHVVVTFEKGHQRSFAESHIVGGPRVRKVEVSVPSFTEVPSYLIGTQRISIMHRRLALSLARHLPLAIIPLPFELPLLREVMQHHSLRDGDHALAWLRGLIRDIAKSLA